MGKIKELFAGQPYRKPACLLVKNAVAEFFRFYLDGVNDYAVSGISSNIRVDYDTGKLSRADLLEILSDSVRTVVRESDLKPDESLRQIALSSANLVLAGTS